MKLKFLLLVLLFVCQQADGQLLEPYQVHEFLHVHADELDRTLPGAHPGYQAIAVAHNQMVAPSTECEDEILRSQTKSYWAKVILSILHGIGFGGISEKVSASKKEADVAFKALYFIGFYINSSQEPNIPLFQVGEENSQKHEHFKTCEKVLNFGKNRDDRTPSITTPYGDFSRLDFSGTHIIDFNRVYFFQKYYKELFRCIDKLPFDSEKPKDPLGSLYASTADLEKAKRLANEDYGKNVFMMTATRAPNSYSSTATLVYQKELSNGKVRGYFLCCAHAFGAEIAMVKCIIKNMENEIVIDELYIHPEFQPEKDADLAFAVGEYEKKFDVKDIIFTDNKPVREHFGKKAMVFSFSKVSTNKDPHSLLTTERTVSTQDLVYTSFEDEAGGAYLFMNELYHIPETLPSQAPYAVLSSGCSGSPVFLKDELSFMFHKSSFHESGAYKNIYWNHLFLYLGKYVNWIKKVLDGTTAHFCRLPIS